MPLAASLTRAARLCTAPSSAATLASSPRREVHVRTCKRWGRAEGSRHGRAYWGDVPGRTKCAASAVMVRAASVRPCRNDLVCTGS